MLDRLAEWFHATIISEGFGHGLGMLMTGGMAVLVLSVILNG